MQIVCMENNYLYFSCCGAGTAADTEYVTNLISSHIQLHSLSTGRQVNTVRDSIFQKAICTMYMGCLVICTTLPCHSDILYSVLIQGLNLILKRKIVLIGLAKISENIELMKDS